MLDAINFLLPASLVCLAWRYPSKELVAVLLLTLTALVSQVMGKTIPLWGLAVTVDSAFIPVLYLVIIASIKQLGHRETLDALNAATLGMLVFCIGYTHWIVFSDSSVYPAQFVEYKENLRHSLLSVTMLYLGGILLIAAHQHFSDATSVARTSIPLTLDIIVTTPISILAVYWVTPLGLSYDHWLWLTLNSAVTRMIVPALCLFVIIKYGKPRYAASSK